MRSRTSLLLHSKCLYRTNKPSSPSLLFTRSLHDDRSRLSKFWLPTGGITTPDDASTPGTALLQKAGYIRQTHSGIWQFLPLGVRVIEKLERLVDKHMRRIGASKLSLSTLSSEALWQKTGRLSNGVEELFRVKDRQGRKYLLSPTHEEEITSLVAGIVNSYRDFPLRVYQVTRKYRDELRPRGGLLRSREFLMKDLYTFDLGPAPAKTTYEDVRGAYDSIFNEIGLPWRSAAADSGTIGGKMSHEYHFLSPHADDTIYMCEGCGESISQDIKTKRAGDECANCHSKYTSHTSIEVGHTFYLGTKYSAPLNCGVRLPNDKNITHAFMGCYGIGISRIFASMASILSSDSALRWPPHLAPFKVVVISDPKDNGSILAAQKWYDDLSSPENHASNSASRVALEFEKGDVVLDDRNRDVVWKIKDADLVGVPVKIILGSQFKKDEGLELQIGYAGESIRISGADRGLVAQTLKRIAEYWSRDGQSREMFSLTQDAKRG